MAQHDSSKRQRTIGSFFGQAGGAATKSSPRATIRNAKCPTAVPVPLGWTTAASSGVACRFHQQANSGQGRAKVAAFDFDGCLADTQVTGTSTAAPPLFGDRTLDVLASLHASGHKLVIISNESLDRYKNAVPLEKALNRKCARIETFLQHLERRHGAVPVQTFVACRKDANRKPETGMWALLESERFNGGVIVDRAQSFYVGDAAGRSGDHSDSDAKFAENLGMLFFTETEFNDEYPFGVAVLKASASPSPSVSAPTPAPTTAVASGGSAEGRPGLIRIVQGDLLSAQAQWIVHQTNCVTSGARGIAKSIFQRHPHADVYGERQKTGRKGVVGTIDARGGDGNRQGIIALYGQYGPGKPKASGHDTAQAREAGFRNGLKAIAQLPGLKSVAFPFQIGCGLAGGDWNSYKAALEEFTTAVAADGVLVTIFQLPGAKFDPDSKVYKRKNLD